MKIAFLAALFQAVAVSVTSAYPITGNGVNCRTGPGTNYAVKRSYAKGTDVKITCQTTGTNINGNNIWDRTSDGCYVADYYVKTGVNDFVTTKCSSSGSGSGAVKDDYPYKSSCGEVDPWKYWKCQCTSFVAYRINKRLDIDFTNMYKGVNWGDASTWDDAARRTGVTVNKTPKPGCIAQTDDGRFGHVAWVAAVGDKTVTIEEYNYGKKEAYSTRTVSKGDFVYIHVKA